MMSFGTLDGMNVLDGGFRTWRSGRRTGDMDLPRAGIVLSYCSAGEKDVGGARIEGLEWYNEKFWDDLRLGIASAIGR